jgi:hypothetical protein
MMVLEFLAPYLKIKDAPVIRFVGYPAGYSSIYIWRISLEYSRISVWIPDIPAGYRTVEPYKKGTKTT